MSVELGTGFISLTVSAKGIQQSIAKEFKGLDNQAGAAGKSAGDTFGSKFADGTKSGDKVAGASRDMGKKIAAGVVVAGTAIAAFAVNSAHHFIDAAEAVKKFQRVAGGSFEDSSRLIFLFKRLSIDPAAATTAIGTLSRKLGDGSVDLAKFGVVVERNADGSVNMKKAIVDLADAFSHLNANDRSAAIFDVLGRGGKQLLPIFSKTKSEIQDIFALAAKDHQIFGKNDIDKAEQYKTSVAELNLAMDGLKVQVGAAVIPLMKGLADVLKPVAGFFSDNADAIASFARIAGGPVLAAVGALVITQKALDFKPAAQSIAGVIKAMLGIGDASAVAAAAETGLAAASSATSAEIVASGVAAESGWLAIAGPIGIGIAAVVGLTVLADALGVFDDEQSKVARNAPKWAQEVVAASIRASGGVKNAEADFKALGKAIDLSRTASTRSSNDLARAAFTSGQATGAQAQANQRLGDTLSDLEARHSALGRVIDIANGSQEKKVKVTAASREVASALSATLGESIQKNGSYAAAQDRLATATARAAAASSGDKTAKKELQDAVNGVATAQERMNNAVLASVDAFIAELGAQQTLDQAIKDNADSLTLQQDASSLAKTKVEEWNQALLASGQAPLNATQQTDIYRQSLVDIATQNPETAASIIPLIQKIDDARRAAENAQGTYPVLVTVDTSEGGKIQVLQSDIDRLHGTTVTIQMAISGAEGVAKAIRNAAHRARGEPEERAVGGPITKGKTYLVGENGPEIFTATQNGRILSHEDSLARLTAAGDGGMGSTTIHLHGIGVLDYGAADRLAAQVAQHLSRNGRSAARLVAGR